MPKAFIALGSNIAPAKENIDRAVSALNQAGAVIKTAHYIASKPEGFAEQADFVNTVLLLETDLKPLPLLKKLKELEASLGRKPTFRNGPRVIDLDILFYDNESINLPDLIIPHKSLAEREFVLVPLNEIAPDFIHPVLHEAVSELLKNLMLRKKQSTVTAL